VLKSAITTKRERDNIITRCNPNPCTHEQTNFLQLTTSVRGRHSATHHRPRGAVFHPSHTHRSLARRSSSPWRTPAWSSSRRRRLCSPSVEDEPKIALRTNRDTSLASSLRARSMRRRALGGAMHSMDHLRVRFRARLRCRRRRAEA
jgi:hypothetical protein